MVFEHRIPEGQEVERETIGVFSKVAAATGVAAAWRVKMILGEKMQSGGRVVDIGTGPGTIPLWLKKFFPASCFFGIDVSTAMLAEAAKHNAKKGSPLHLLAGDGRFLPFPDKSLDGIISFFTLHHINEPAVFFHEIDRVLRPDGFLLLIDFRRDMPRLLFRMLNSIWQAVFCLSAGRRGFYESVASAWREEELRQMFRAENMNRFTIATTKTELIVM